MRQSSSRLVIYTVIGIGLLILVASSLRRGDEAANASFVGDSTPFEALRDFQPSIAATESAPERVDSVEAIEVSAPPLALEDSAAELPVEIPVEIPVELRADANDSVPDFVNTPKPVEMPAVNEDEEDPYYDFAIDSADETLPTSYDEAPNTEAIELTSTQSPVTPESAPTIIEEAAPQATTGLPTFGSTINRERGRIINTHVVNRSQEAGDADSQSSAWKKNPFLTDAPVESPSSQSPPADTITTNMIAPQAEAIVDTSSSAEAMLPSVDLETMESVIAQEQNLEGDSPSIKIGISEADAQKAVHNIEYGKSLSRRGAAYAARQEFYASLRILAQSHDKQVGGTNYTQALRSGILAIKEAQDFIVTDTEAQIGLSVTNVIETHSTKIISTDLAQGMTAIEAAQRYFAYASHQLSRCGGQNVVAAEALYCLGKLHSVQAKSGSNDSKLDLAKAMIYHQAAISANSSNFRSLNELGVLYANGGRFEEAKHMLKKSLRIKALPQAWQNLSVIHQRMGEHQLAQLANREFEMSSSQAPISVIRWTPAEEFNKNIPLSKHTATQASAILPDSQNTKSPTSGLRSLGGRILDSIR